MIPVPDSQEIHELARRARAAGSPGAAARPRLLNDYRRITAAMGLTAENVVTGADLVRATSALLRAKPAPRPTEGRGVHRLAALRRASSPGD